MPAMENRTLVTEFILWDFTDNRRVEILLFTILFGTYLLTILGNMVIIMITLLNPKLYTPMYFFLRHFAVLEVGFTTTVIPKALANLAVGQKNISVLACFMQVYLYLVLGATESLLLAVMSIDRYVAICNPLHYATIMNSRTCSLLVLSSWAGGILLMMAPTLALFQLSFCGPNAIDHFFCDIGPLIKLACMDTSVLELMFLLIVTLCIFGPLAVNVVSFINIISTIICIPSTAGRQKAFSTCASHFIVISISYGSCIFMYVKPKGTSELDFSKGVALLNTVVSPLLNPYIYCLRNKQFQDALRAGFRQSVVFCKSPR
ncbi:olfactory receptor 6C74-like [Rhineura floridana]|uniref:olfactory receptor 6C74-like n=1 Tax=Rhineura floridana TaxID=261503 RepID=UPI002AC86882|nr:olfactory receptor 6C74-like [Rhineura floridana]